MIPVTVFNSLIAEYDFQGEVVKARDAVVEATERFELAETYLLDGAPHSALRCIRQGLALMRGTP